MNNRHSIWLLFSNGHQILDLAGPIAALSAVNDLFPDAPPYEIKLVANEEGVVSGNTPIRIISDACWSDLHEDRVDTLIVAGLGQSFDKVQHRDMIDFILTTSERAKRVCSICTGAFLLSAAGLLNGRRATTHWSVTSELAALFPAVLVDSNAIYTRDGMFWTSAGVTAGLDMTLALIQADHGHEVALSVARRLVVYMIRPGGQAQFSVHNETVKQRSDVISSTLCHIEENLAKAISVSGLAISTGMSVRNFSRRFKEEVGQSPLEFILARRLRLAQQLLETSTLSVKSISGQTGFSSAHTLYRAFYAHFSVGPTQYRQRFARDSA